MSLHKDLRMYGLDPDAERVRVTRMVWGDRGRATVGAAPDLPSEPAALDVALMLDMAHHLSDEELHRTVADLARRMGDQGTLLMRVTVPTDKRFSWERWLEKIRFRMLGIGAPLFRTPAEITALMEAAGFGVRQVMATAKNREETWFVGEVGGKTTAWE
jgi:hypothetical protein